MKKLQFRGLAARPLLIGLRSPLDVMPAAGQEGAASCDKLRHGWENHFMSRWKAWLARFQ
jgi:hypothetical protein